MNMKKTLIIAGIVILAVIAGACVYLSSFKSPSGAAAKNSAAVMSPISPESLTQNYSDSVHAFAFKYPKGYAVSSAPAVDTGGETIVVQASSSAASSSIPLGFEIVITPTDEDISVLTVDRIRQDLPDMVIDDPQDVILGEGKGVAFLSDDPDFGGKSRNVWFIFKKDLYQITTYAADDPLLQAVLNTWQFK